MDKTNEFFDAWLKGQEKIFGGFLENAKKTQEFLLGQMKPGFTGNTGGFDDFFSSWTKAVQQSMDPTGHSNMQVLRDNLSRMLGGSNAYIKLYELWFPLMKAMQEKTLSADSYKDAVDPARYKELIDKVFGFDLEAYKVLLNESLQLLELSSLSGQQFVKPWLTAAKASLDDIPQLAQGHPESLIKIFHSMFNAFDSTLGRAFHVPPVGKDREKIELVLRTIDDISVFAAKNIEFQHVIYTTGLTAMEKVVESLAGKIKAGGEVKKFDEFFDIWIDVSEKSYFDLFQTEEFSKLQGEVLDAGLYARTRFFKVMEMHLYDLPIVLRSEMDDHYKTVYELKKKVKSLEKRLLETQQ